MKLGKQFINHNKIQNQSLKKMMEMKTKEKKDDNVVDADFEEVKDENKEKSA